MSEAPRPCPICSCSVTFSATAVGERWLVRCARCRHVFWCDDVSDEHLAAYYARTYTELHDQKSIQQSERDYYRAHMLELEDWLRVRPIRCLVDFGCSVPVCLEEAQRCGYARVVGVDYGEQVLKAGRSVGLDMFDPPAFFASFPDGTADVIRLSHVIEHMREPRLEMRRIVEKLAPGGIVYVTQPIFPALRADARDIPYSNAVFPEHLHFFNPISIVELLVQCGLEIEQFFAFQNAEQTRAIYEPAQDCALVESWLPVGIGAVPGGFDARGGRPTFFGENCRVVARTS